MSDVVLKVDDQLCHSFPTHDDMTAVDALPAKIDIQCDPPLTGRTVKLEKVNPQIDDNYYFLINICEVQDANVEPTAQAATVCVDSVLEGARATQ
nr:hypothetical protein BaRGS_001039 [Batillaria attramentaria]